MLRRALRKLMMRRAMARRLRARAMGVACEGDGDCEEGHGDCEEGHGDCEEGWGHGHVDRLPLGPPLPSRLGAVADAGSLSPTADVSLNIQLNCGVDFERV